MNLPDFFVQIPIDSRGNSPRFEYRPITYADLEGLGERVWWCDYLQEPVVGCRDENSNCGWRLLIPLPEQEVVK